MNLKRALTVACKEWREIIRDRLFLSLAIFVPTFLMVLFGYGLSLDVENIPLAIMDHDGSSMSRDYSYRFLQSRYFDFKGYVRNEKEFGPLLSDNKIRAAIIIPEHFQDNLLSGRPAHVQILIDGTFTYRAETAKGYVIAINNALNSELLADYLSNEKGISPEEAKKILEPVRLQVRYLYNQSIKSIWSIPPKLMALMLMISSSFLTALGVVREKETGSIYNIYSSTVSRLEFLIGKLAPYAGISALNSLIMWLLATNLFGAPFKGSFMLFFIASVFYVLCTTGIGLLVSVFARTQVAAMIVTFVLSFIIAILYSGVMIPIESLGRDGWVMAHMFPAMYYNNVIVGSFPKGVGFKVLWLDVAVLALFAVALFTAGYLLFSKRPKA